MSTVRPAFGSAQEEVNKLDVAIECLKKLEDQYSALNRNEGQGFFMYLRAVAKNLGLSDEASLFADVSDLLKGNLQRATFIASHRPKDGVDEAFIPNDMDPNFLNAAFRALAAAGGVDVPKSHMNFMLRQIGQPLLPQGKIGWMHTKPFGG